MKEVYEDAINYLKYYGEKNDEKIEHISYFLEKELKKYIQLQSNWNSLRELIEQKIYLIEPKGTCINFYCEYDSEDDYVQGMKDQARLNTLKSILDKMNELEGVNNGK